MHQNNMRADETIYTKNQIQLSVSPKNSFLVWLSHDVDRIFKSLFHSTVHWIRDKKFKHFTSLLSGRNTYWNFNRIMDIEAQYDVKSTFFFLNESMRINLLKPKTFLLAKASRYSIFDPNIQAIIQKLDQEGWEIGLHGSYQSYNNATLLKEEKNALENIVGHRVDGIRQHYLNLSIPQTWEIHKSIGLKYDASYGLNEDVGFRNQVSHPFRPFNNDFVVFPITIMDIPLFRKYRNLSTVWDTCLKLIDQAEKNRTLLSILWHQRVFNEDDFPGFSQIYKRLMQECQKRNACFCTGRNIFNYIKPVGS
jgi:peptidoglycan/xylan/chitin deacetylase (PgdA/CDA1 family)